jgi:predicted TIM-barrel fold metal-dependent hydrolase
MAMKPLDPAGPTHVGEIVDAHTHLFTVGVLEEALAQQPPEAMKRWRTAVKERKFGRRGDQTLPDMTPGECAAWYVERLHAAGISRAVVMSVLPDSQWTRDFLVAANGHVHALCNLDPRDPGAPALLEREMAAGFRGVKLLPVNRCFRISDPACRPLLQKAAELGAAVTVHYGVTVDPTGDLRFADPLDLSPVARDFPTLPFVIAHFGAGWLKQALQLAYQCSNVCLDTSGTNNWLDNHVPRMTLPEVFERALTALGPERVLFGTDSGTTAPYRTWIAYQQRRILEEMGLSDDVRDLVLRGNAARIFRLDEPLLP